MRLMLIRGVAEQRAHAADDARLILVADQERRTLGDRLEAEVVDAHDARLGAAEDRARDQVRRARCASRTRTVTRLTKSSGSADFVSITRMPCFCASTGAFT